ncbi:MAG: GNAT family N-acetyltransferase [Clostridia bacterium]|nr:GNAT family N-acetyltransferase [Clostridia bacterium]
MAETGGITVRRAEPEDFGRIETLLRDIGELHRMHRPDIFGDAAVKYSSDEFAEILADAGRPVYVACGRDGTVIGYAFCVIRDIKETKLLNERREMYLDDLCVDGSFRGQGVGSILFRHVSDEAARFGCTSLELNVWSFNSPAIAFYEKMGMKPRNTHYEIRVGDGGDAAGGGNGRLKLK